MSSAKRQSAKRGRRPEVTRHESAQQVSAAVTAFIALHAHDLDEHGIAVLKRLSESGRNSDRLTAAEAIVASLPGESWNTLFADCILAERRARNHPSWISDAQSVLDRSEDAQKALSLIVRFLERPWPPKRISRDPDIVEMQLRLARDPVHDALDTLRYAIAMKQRLASEHLQLYSRKTTRDGARAAGIGWIHESLIRECHRVGRQPAPRCLAAIATAALNMGEVTGDAARKAPVPSDRLNALYDTARSG
jgi:hypothetical protein